MHPILQQLMEVVGENQFNAYFGPQGDLNGFEPSGAYSVNGLDVSIDEIFRLFGQFGDGSQNIISISVE